MITKNITASTTIRVCRKRRNTGLLDDSEPDGGCERHGQTLHAADQPPRKRARNSRLGPRTEPIATPWIGRRNRTPRPDIPAA